MDDESSEAKPNTIAFAGGNTFNDYRLNSQQRNHLAVFVLLGNKQTSNILFSAL